MLVYDAVSKSEWDKNSLEAIATLENQETHQFPSLCLQLSTHTSILLISRSPSNKHRTHEMIIRTMSIPILRVFHQPRHPSSQIRPTVLLNHILNRLPELEHLPIWWRLLSKVVPVS
jgi:hypothetical protein